MINKFINKNSQTTLIVLHGSGGNELDLIPLANYIDNTANILAIRGAINENGNYRYFRRHQIGDYDLDSFKIEAIKLASFIKEAGIEYKFDLSKAVLIGFSNGANIIQGMLQYDEISVLKIVLLSPAYINPLVSFNDAKGKSIVMTLASNDPYESASMLEKLESDLINNKAIVTVINHDGGHMINQIVLDKIKKWYNQSKSAK